MIGAVQWLVNTLKPDRSTAQLDSLEVGTSWLVIRVCRCLTLVWTLVVLSTLVPCSVGMKRLLLALIVTLRLICGRSACARPVLLN